MVREKQFANITFILSTFDVSKCEISTEVKDSHPLKKDVRSVFFVKDECKANFPTLFQKTFGDDFLLLTREEVLENKVFGSGKENPDLPGMIGDFVAFAISEKSILKTHYEVQEMPGEHAGLTPEEINIPLIVIDTKNQ